MKKFSLGNDQCGSSMIEVLVTMIIVAVGLLGHAGLIGVSLKSNNSAYLRSQATLLSYDIIERIRMNKALAKAGSFNITIGGTVPVGTAIQLTELNDWRANIAQSLPSGDGSVSVDGSGNVTIVIRWIEIIKGSGTPTNFTTQSTI
jgi:type IV pilus assembly protein PilV